MRSYIPQTLDEVIDVERDTLRVADGGGKDVSYKQALIGYMLMMDHVACLCKPIGSIKF